MSINHKNLVEISTQKSNPSTNVDFQSLGELQLSIEDKAAHLALQVNQVIIKPYLNQALDYLINSRDEILASYHNLSQEIEQEVVVLNETNRLISAKIADAKHLVAQTQSLIRNRYNSTTEFEIASGVLNLDQEYNTVAENYEKSMQFSQEVIKNRMRIESLLETQRLLDSSMSSRMSEVQLEIDNLSFLLENLHSYDVTPTAANHAEFVLQFKKADALMNSVLQNNQTLGFGQDNSLKLHTNTKFGNIAHDLRHLVNFDINQEEDNKNDKPLYIIKNNSNK